MAQNRTLEESATPIECHGDVRAFFRERVTAALEDRQVQAEPAVEFYLVNLLSHFAAKGSTAVLGQTLVELEARALQRQGRARYETLRTLGDRALYVSGFFEAALERRGISRRYYAHVGRRAYRRAGELASHSEAPGDRARSDVLMELGERFSKFAEVLDDVRERTAMHTDGDVYDLLVRYQRSQSPRVAARLQRRGVMPPWGRNRRGRAVS